MNIRRYDSADLATLKKLFLESLYKINIRDYTKEQIDAWAAGWSDDAAFDERFRMSLTLVAEKSGRIVGFANLDRDVIDMLYVIPDFNGRGVGTELVARLESAARRRGVLKLTTYASATARGFFEKRGWAVTRPNTVMRSGVLIQNYVLEKLLI